MSGSDNDGHTNLPAGWACTALEEICQINPPLDRRVPDDASEVNFVPIRAVEPEGGGLVRPELRAYGEVKKGYTPFLSGDVIMAKITPCMENGKTTVVPDLPGLICFGSTEFHVVRPDSVVTPRWIANYLVQHRVRRTAQRAMTGGVGQMRVPASFLETLRIPVAPSGEQERIADAVDELFSDLDAGVAALERVREKLRLYRASVLKAAVEGTLTAEWRRRHPQIETAPVLLKRILADRRRRWEEDQFCRYGETGRNPPKNWKAKYAEPNGPEPVGRSSLPNGWCWSSLGQCFSVHVGATPSRATEKYWDGDIPWVASGEVQFCRILDTRERISAEGLANTSTQINPVGSVILNMIGEGKTRGKVGILEIAACNNQNCAAIWVSETPIRSHFIYYWLMFQYEQTRQLGSGNNQPAMNKSVVERVAFPLPSLEEQDAILEMIEDQMSVIEHLEYGLDVKLKNAQSLRQSILRHAFNGRLVPQDPKTSPPRNC